MTVDVSDWYEPLRLSDFVQVNEESGKNVPDQVPVEEPLGGADIRCGPILRLAGTKENGSENYRGSLMLVVKDAIESPRIRYKIGPADNSNSSDGSKVNSKTVSTDGEFPSTKYFEEEGFSFFRYQVNLDLADYEQRVKYFINGCFKQSFQFYVPAIRQSMNVMSYSCNGFSLGTDAEQYKSSMWLDVLKKHKDLHYHVMLGGGDQIYADSIKIQTKCLQKWFEERNPIKKKHMKPSEKDLKEISHYYLNHYMAWFGKGFWIGKSSKTLQSVFPLAMSQIPSINIYDDHDIIDGFGSYRRSTMSMPFFEAIGNTAFKYYMLFQHQMSLEEKSQLSDPSWILGKSSGPYIHERSHSTYVRLGEEMAMVGLDCRTERSFNEIVSESTYNIVFQRLDSELKRAPEVKHVLLMLGVPIFYPRLVWLEWLLTSRILKPFQALAVKGVLSKGLVNEFDGSVEVLDDLNDHWCSKNHKRERNYFVQRLVNFASEKGVRVTILSGDVHLCCIGRIKSKFHHHPHAHILSTSEELKKQNVNTTKSPEADPRLIFNVTSSAIINAPPPDAMAALLESRSGIHHFNRDCDEDVVPLFRTDTDGSKRRDHQFMNKRNWSDLVLAKQSVYKDKVDEGIKRFPGPKGHDNELDGNTKIDQHNIKYPLMEDSLIATLHVENNPRDYESKTAAYEVFIPKLVGKFKLNDAPVKHVS